MDRGKLLIDSSKDWRVIYKHREMRNKILIAMAIPFGLSIISFVLEVSIWPVYLFPATIILYIAINLDYVRVYENGFTSGNKHWRKEVFITWSNIETITRHYIKYKNGVNIEKKPDYFFIIVLRNKVPGLSKSFYLGLNESSFADTQEFDIIASKHISIIDGDNKF